MLVFEGQHIPQVLDYATNLCQFFLLILAKFSRLMPVADNSRLSNILSFVYLTLKAYGRFCFFLRGGIVQLSFVCR